MYLKIKSRIKFFREINPFEKDKKQLIKGSLANFIGGLLESA